MNGRMGFARASISLPQIETFVAVADAGTLTAAAAALHTSQSNVSVALSKLEQQLGVEVFVRQRSKGVALTREGRQLLGRARSILEDVRRLEESASGARDDLRGELRFGCYVPLTSFYVPPLVAALGAAAPALAVEVREGAQDELQDAVAGNDLDLALVYDQNVPDGLRFVPLVRVWPYAIAARDSSIAAAGSVSLRELARHTMISYEASFTVERSLDLFRSAGLRPPEEVRARSLDSVRALVAAGMGFAILNQRWASGATASGAEVDEVEIEDDVEPMQLGVIMRPSAETARLRLAVEQLRHIARRRHSGPPPAAGPPR